MKLISGLIGLIILALALAFALNNRQSITISLWPFGLEVMLPLYLLSLGTLFIGLLAGATIGWTSALRHRFEARRLRKDITHLHDKLHDLQQTILPPDANGPTLPSPKRRWRMWEPHP